MKELFKKGDKKKYVKVVEQTDIAAFESGVVHEVYSTFALTRDAEWSGRLFVLEMKEEEEEGIGTSISVQHKSPAFVGDKIEFIACFEEITDKGEIITSYEARCGNRLIAIGVQGQRILPKEKIDALFQSVQNS
jgi:fluoroacetyl-CoA thioesterase